MNFIISSNFLNYFRIDFDNDFYAGVFRKNPPHPLKDEHFAPFDVYLNQINY